VFWGTETRFSKSYERMVKRRACIKASLSGEKR
jgi:hypothetical protein